MKKRLQKIREIVDAATPGPWRVDGDSGDWDVEADHHILGGTTDHMFFRREDAQFVACARSVMPDLLDQIARMSITISDLDRKLTDALACNTAQADKIDDLTAALETQTETTSKWIEVNTLATIAMTDYERDRQRLRAENDRLRAVCKQALFALAGDEHGPDRLLNAEERKAVDLLFAALGPNGA